MNQNPDAPRAEFYTTFIQQLGHLYPKTAERLAFTERISPNLVCPEVVQFPKRWLNQAEDVVRSFASLRELRGRQSELAELEPVTRNPGHFSALMSYDFHVDSEDRLRLIEINTNASMALVADTIYRTVKLENGISTDFRKEIVATFAHELELFRRSQGQIFDAEFAAKTPIEVVIIDENPAAQRLYAEFEMYRELFEQHGWHAQIADPADFTFRDGSLWLNDRKIDLVYNRDTDFYLAHPRSEQLRHARDAGAVCVTPSAYEYRLLADKERLEELSKPGVIQNLDLTVSEKSIISRTLIRTLSVSDFRDPDELWRLRKSFFFKPRRSFGGKAVYRGSSTSRGTFAQILDGDYLAQEFIPPSTVQIAVAQRPTSDRPEEGSQPQMQTTSGPVETQEFKCDLRFYAYQGRVQLSCARLYQGQMTNSQTLGGGVAAIDWVP